jgi:hypothetical protein
LDHGGCKEGKEGGRREEGGGRRKEEGGRREERREQRRERGGGSEGAGPLSKLFEGVLDWSQRSSVKKVRRREGRKRRERGELGA